MCFGAVFQCFTAPVLQVDALRLSLPLGLAVPLVEGWVRFSFLKDGFLSWKLV